MEAVLQGKILIFNVVVFRLANTDGPAACKEIRSEKLTCYLHKRKYSYQVKRLNVQVTWYEDKR